MDEPKYVTIKISKADFDRLEALHISEQRSKTAIVHRALDAYEREQNSTVARLKEKYHDAARAEDEAWKAQGKLVDEWQAGNITAEQLGEHHNSCVAFLVAKETAYSQLQAAYQSQAEFIAENE
jgi:predicted transcriptional regulator